MLADQGFQVIPGPFGEDELESAIRAYDRAVAAVRPDERKAGSTSVRVNSLLNHARELAAITAHPPLLQAAAALIGVPFKLSSFHSRSIRPGADAQALHQDVAPGGDGWPLLAFIFMVDGFHRENGATRFLPGSARMTASPETADRDEVQYACGAAGALIVYDGSVWHGHGANSTSAWRRSIQGAFIPRTATAAVDHRRELRPEVWAGLPQEVRSVVAGI